MPHSILIVDDHPLVSTALALAARAADPQVRVDTAATLAEAEARGRGDPPSVVLLDLMLPDAQGFAGLALLRALWPGTPVAIVSSRDEEAVASRAVALGAAGFIPKSAPMDRMVGAIRALLTRGRWPADGAPAEPAPRGSPGDGHGAAERIGTLSAAQLRVLRAVAGGAQNKRIAFDLDLAEATVKSHLAAIFRKLGVANRTQAVLALRAYDVDEVGA